MGSGNKLQQHADTSLFKLIRQTHSQMVAAYLHSQQLQSGGVFHSGPCFCFWSLKTPEGNIWLFICVHQLVSHCLLTDRLSIQTPSACCTNYMLYAVSCCLNTLVNMAADQYHSVITKTIFSSLKSYVCLLTLSMRLLRERIKNISSTCAHISFCPRLTNPQPLMMPLTMLILILLL